MHAHGVPDTTQSYLIQSVATPSVEQLVALTPEGLLYSLHGKAYKPSTTDYLADYPKGITRQEASQALPQEYALATSRAKQAEVAASRLFELRERRVELLSGQVETMPCLSLIHICIRRVVYGEQYRLTDGVELLERAGIEVVYIPLDTAPQATEQSSH